MLLISKVIDASQTVYYSYLATFSIQLLPSEVHGMATTELQAPYTSVETEERENNGTVLEMKEPDSRSSEVKLQNEHLMSNSSASNHKNKFSNLRNINWLRGVEIFVLIIVILVVWILFAIPTVIYALDNRKVIVLLG